ncbi:MAG: hypothetical protein KDB53_17345, partial [Planctomycetes bacterium]|nr:hypothetical protein [Planctomycetota bacterium]
CRAVLDWRVRHSRVRRGGYAMKTCQRRLMRWTATGSVASLVLSLLMESLACSQPTNVGCVNCHDQEVRYCQHGPHQILDCATCHGPGEQHANAGAGPRPELRLGTADLCLSCHQAGSRVDSRVVSTIETFETHLQDLEQDHRIRLDRGKSGQDCVFCHDPHLLE